ncbi:MAG: nitroreductase family protein [Bradymonadales bacterium]
MTSCCGEKKIVLPAPSFDRDTMTVSEAISKRRSVREYSKREPDKQILANLLYFSAGITDKEEGKLAAPTANNRQEIDLYVAAHCGVYRYDPKEHALHCVCEEDRRADTGEQKFCADALYNFIYVFNAEKAKKITDESKRRFYQGSDSALMASQTALYATAVGLNHVIRAWFDKDKVAKACDLKDGDLPVLALTVG